MEFSQVLETRHSTREFTNQVVSDELITKIVAAAQQAPSWVNSQPWKVYVATGDTLNEIKAAYQAKEAAGLKSNPDIPVMSREDWPTYSQHNMKVWRSHLVHAFPDFETATKTMTNLATNFNFAPVVVYLTIPKGSSDWSLMDLGGFAQTLLLAATSYGVDSLITYASVRFPNIVREYLSIPQDELICIGIELGYSKEGTLINNYRSDRLPVEEILKIKH